MPEVKFLEEDNKFLITIGEEDIKVFNPDEWCDFRDRFNAIIKFIEDQGWREGYRNTMAVDLMILANELKIIKDNNDYTDLLKFMKNLVKQNKLNSNAELDFEARANVIVEYLYWWEGSPYYYLLNDKDINAKQLPSLYYPIDLMFADGIDL